MEILSNLSENKTPNMLIDQENRLQNLSDQQEQDQLDNQSFQVKEIEGLNNKVIQEELEKQLKLKLEKIDYDIESYQRKLVTAKESIKEFEKKPNNKNFAAVKKLQSSVQFYQSYIKSLQNRKERMQSEFDQAIKSEGLQNMELLDNFFSKQQDAKHSEKKVKRSLLEITIDGDRQFYISELFYNLLFKHQVEALNWLLSQHSQNKGSILADEMGLGKTIQTIALITALFTTYYETLNNNLIEQSQNSVGAILIVCPATVINQWVQELKLWTTGLEHQLEIFTFTSGKHNDEEVKATKKNKAQIIQEAFKKNGIVIASYEFLRSEVVLFQRRTWFYVILDEAQKIKNSLSQTHQAAISIQAKHRLILSGTPMQNNLQELWSLFHFVQPGLLGELDYFENTFCKAIIKGGYTNATKVQQQTAKECVDELRMIIKRHILRRTKKQLKMDCKLPDRNEYIVFCNLTQAQLSLYEKYLVGSQQHLDKSFNHNEALAILNCLRKICNHPFLYFAFHDAPMSTSHSFRFQQQRLINIPEYQLYTRAKQQLQKDQTNDDILKQLKQFFQ